jgi:hypothetical protein
MLSLKENIVILITAMAASWIFLAALNRLWAVPIRRAQNDLIGWQLSVLGTTYAVVLGFMLYTAWTGFQDAELNVELEASSLRNIFRLAEGLPQPQRASLETLAKEYADAVVEQDWPVMARAQIPEQTHEINERMWRTLMSVKTASASENTAEDHALSELSSLTQHRRTRLLQSVSRLPIIFWGVLIAGGLLTLISASMFGSANAGLHALQLFSLTFLIVLVLLAIADVNRPFQGWVHVDDYAFQRAQQNMREGSDPG